MDYFLNKIKANNLDNFNDLCIGKSMFQKIVSAFLHLS